VRVAGLHGPGVPRTLLPSAAFAAAAASFTALNLYGCGGKGAEEQ